MTDVREAGDRIIDEIERTVVGKRDVLELCLIGILANGHILIEDFPGLAKTLIARCFADVTGLDFRRIQFTPDLMPSDVTGSSIYDQRSGQLEFKPGPIFANLILGDEINRAPPKTQAAMLEAMAERQVTADGVTHMLPPPFVVIATQNPIEYEGTYPLPEAQLDRFLLRVSVGYPSHAEEEDILRRRIDRRADSSQLTRIVEPDGLLALQHAIEDVHVDASIGHYIVDLVAATRQHASVQVGASPRGSLALLAAARARAARVGRDYVVPEDVKFVTVPALAHRLSLRPEVWVRGVRDVEIVQECLGAVPTPPAETRDTPA
jgi:MoxR-like ATPase